MHRLLVIVALVFASVPSSRTVGQAPLPDVEKMGPQVGQVVPDFELADQDGTPRTLKSLLGPNGAMLVFFRSADW
jgi:cytochrome oxidase Cu insertion factor (SCO1/SenC/PrrC family)